MDESCEPDEHELHRTAVVEWLAVQRVATIRPAEAPGRYADLTDPKNLHNLSHHPRVATHLGQVHQDGWIDRPLLDGAALRVSGPQGRALTQALSRAVSDAQPRPDGDLLPLPPRRCRGVLGGVQPRRRDHRHQRTS